MNVLSLFDGMSCGQQSLDRLGIHVDNYFASEIDKHAIKVTMANYPGTIQLGSVVDIDPDTLPQIDLLLGGSPCQSFSFAGKRKGMSTKDETEILTLDHYLELRRDGYEFEGQSYLFWEYMRILTALRKRNPDIKFLLENVMMGEKWEKVLSRAIGVNPIEINSALVSAQNRRRLYWTNIGMEPSGFFGDPANIIKQPLDEGILLRDILEPEVVEKYYLKPEVVENLMNWEVRNKEKGNGFGLELRPVDEKSAVLSTGSMKSSSTFLKIDKAGKPKANQDKASCFTAGAHSGGNHSDMDLIAVGLRTVRTEEQKAVRKESLKKGKDWNCFGEKDLVPRGDVKIGAIMTGKSKDNLILQLNPSTESGGQQPFQQNRVYDPNGISPALMAQLSSGSPAILEAGCSIRRLTPVECERLQTVVDNYTAHVSDTQRYRMLGNGWTIKVIMHILSYMNFNPAAMPQTK